MAKTVRTDDARQGRRGWQVLVVLAVALLLAMGAWFGAEMFGQSSETPRTQGNVTSTPDAPSAPAPAPAPATE